MRYRQHQFILDKAVIEYLCVLHTRAHDSKFKVSAENAFDGVHGVGNAQAHGDVRVLAFKVPEDRRQHVLPRDATATDQQFPTHTTLQLLQGLHSGGFDGEQPLRIVVQHFSCMRERDLSTKSIKEHECQILLQRFDMAADRGLGQQQGFGSFRKAAKLCDVVKDLNLSEV